MHRAAEVGSIICAEILLCYKANIDALNYAGQTPFHIASLNKNIEFGQFLLKR
jgi:ankyrin repeat protein